MEHLERRLRSVESRLVALEQSPSTLATGDAVNLGVSSSESRPKGDGYLFEGKPSFTNQSLQASESARIAAHADSTNNDSTTIDHSFQGLQNDLRASQGLMKSNFFFSKSSLQFLSTSQPLPATLVTCILQGMRGMLCHLQVVVVENFLLTILSS